MNLERLHHVAIEVSDLDYYTEQACRDRRHEAATPRDRERPGIRMAMVADPPA
jgi:hypothetical protein